MIAALVLAAVVAASAPPETVDVTRAPAADSTVVDSAVSVARPAPPRRDYLAEMRAAFTPETRAYWGTRVALAFIEPLAVILAGLLVLFSGLAAKMRDVAQVLGHSRWVQLLIVLVIFTLVTMLLTFPLSWYS